MGFESSENPTVTARLESMPRFESRFWWLGLELNHVGNNVTRLESRFSQTNWTHNRRLESESFLQNL